MPTIQDVEDDLLARAKGASVEQLGTISTALKAVAEAKFTEVTARNKGRETRLETFKSAGTFLVPIVSLLALAGTILAQSMQVGATRQQIEDTEWRDLLGSLKGASETVYSDPTVAPRLRSFFGSATYADQAKSIAGRLMGHISNPDGFRDLFASVFGVVTHENVGSVLDIGRALQTSRQALLGQCNDLLNGLKIAYDPGLVDCGSYVDDATASELTTRLKVPAQFSAMRRSGAQLDRENYYLNGKLTAFVRTFYGIPRDRRASPGLDVSESSLVTADMSDIDLSDFNIAGTIFDTVDFRGAILNPRNRTQGSPMESNQPDFRGSTWWDARYVEPALLAFLAEWYFPYVRPTARYPAGYSISRDAYEAKLLALCAAAPMPCPTPIKFGTK